MYVLPGIIVARYFRSIKRGIIGGVSAFATPLTIAFLLGLFTALFVKPEAEALEGWAMASIVFGIIVGYPLGLIIPLLVFKKRTIKPNQRMDPTLTDAD